MTVPSTAKRGLRANKNQGNCQIGQMLTEVLWINPFQIDYPIPILR